MLLDKENTFSAAQVVTGSAASTDFIDRGAAGGVPQGLPIVVSFDESAAAVGSATVDVSIQCDDDPAFPSPKTVGASGPVGKALLAAGKDPIILYLNENCDERYVRLYYTVASGPLTAGKFSASVAAAAQSNKAYPGIV